MYVSLKQPGGDGERYVTLARAAAKETTEAPAVAPFEAGHHKTYLICSLTVPPSLLYQSPFPPPPGYSSPYILVCLTNQTLARAALGECKPYSHVGQCRSRAINPV